MKAKRVPIHWLHIIRFSAVVLVIPLWTIAFILGQLQFHGLEVLCVLFVTWVLIFVYAMLRDIAGEFFSFLWQETKPKE